MRSRRAGTTATLENNELHKILSGAPHRVSLRTAVGWPPH